MPNDSEENHLCLQNDTDLKAELEMIMTGLGQAFEFKQQELELIAKTESCIIYDYHQDDFVKIHFSGCQHLFF